MTTQATLMLTATTIIADILSKKGIDFGELGESQSLFDEPAGLDSLEFAELVIRLQIETGIDPFAGEQPDTFPNTIGELVELYVHRLVGKATTS